MHNYGNDLMLKDGDILANAGGDFYTTDEYEVSSPEESQFPGFYNLYISLTDRLFAEEGDNVFHPDYSKGFIKMVSRPNSLDIKEHLQKAAADTFMADDRVQSVERVDIEQKNNTVMIRAKVLMKGASTVSEFVFPNFVIE